MNSSLLMLTILISPVMSPTAPCDPKRDPGCGNRTASAELVPVPDPISTPGAAAANSAPCDPKKDPGCG